MIARADCDDPPRPFWQELAIAVLTAAAVPLAHHAGKALREAMAAKRAQEEPNGNR